MRISDWSSDVCSSDLRLAVILGHAGNREDADLRAVATTAAGFGPELVVLKDIGGYERGRESGDVARIMREALGEAGIGDDAIETRLDEVEAARRPLEWGRDGDLVVLPVPELDADPNSVGVGKSVSVRVDRGGGRCFKKKK